jgi:hypothetical protein
VTARVQSGEGAVLNRCKDFQTRVLLLVALKLPIDGTSITCAGSSTFR